MKYNFNSVKEAVSSLPPYQDVKQLNDTSYCINIDSSRKAILSWKQYKNKIRATIHYEPRGDIINV